jgi:RNA polymerase sigma factor (sigma-70 family)
MELMLFDAARGGAPMEFLPASPEVDARVESCQRMVFSFAKRIHSRYPRVDFEEIVSYLQRVLWRSASTYDPTLGVKFSTFAFNGLKFGIRNIGERFRTRRRLQTRSLNTKFDFEGSPSVLNALAEAEEASDRESSLAREIAQLDPRTQHIIDGRFNRGLTLEQVGEELKITKEYVRQLQNKALATLRRRLGVDDPDAPTPPRPTVSVP